MVLALRDGPKISEHLSGTGDSQRDLRESFAIETLFL